MFAIQVAEEIWVCENECVTKWEGDILSYKDHLKSKVLKNNKDDPPAKAKPTTKKTTAKKIGK
jgi:hypothetical protein